MSGIDITPGIIIVVLVLSLTCSVSVVSAAGSLTIQVKDARTRAVVPDALVYFDGGYAGATSSSDGSFVIQDPREGTHTVRITKPDYKEVTKKFSYPAESVLDISLATGPLVSLNPDGPKANAIDVVFVPSSTSYSCANKQIIQNNLYISNESRFRQDVENVIRLTYLNLEKSSTSPEKLPANSQKYFNFYYYYDPSSPADAFSGCAGTVPEKYWKDVTFSDVTVILYPTYSGIYNDASCQPTGCYQNFGPGRNVMKAPADQVSLVRHESGHAVFELVDTYCGTTYYYQNDPYPNVWASREACRADATTNNRDPELCRQIESKAFGSSPACTQDFWRWDPNPDIMGQGYSGKFGAAATQRIGYVMTKVGAG